MAGENINRRLNIYINDREVVNSMRGITGEMAHVRNQMRNLNRGAADYDQQLHRLRNTYAQLQNQQAAFRNDMAQVPSILGRIRNALGPVGVGFLTAFSVTAIVSKVTTELSKAFNKVVEFDQKQADLAAVLGKTRGQISGLTIDAIKYGASTAYSSTEVSVLQTELARLGKTAPEIKAMTKDVLNAATALETDLGSAATLVGGQLNSYGENADKAGKYSDIMANSVNISATSYEYLATSLPKVSAVAAQNNVTFEKLNGTLGVLADQNIQAETAGTGFRNILLESAKAGRPYQEMLDEIKNSANQSKTAVDLFGKENATVAVILANSTDKINANTEALENSAGSAEKLAKEKMNSIKGSIESFSGAWEGFILSIEKGDGFIGKAIRGVIDLGTSFLGLITPMERVSDQLQKEQLDLNMLVSRITSSNISNEERKRLLIQLKNEYPDFIANINTETVSNDQLNSALKKVNEQYVKRIALQLQVEKVEDAQKESGEKLAIILEKQEKLFGILNKMKLKYKLDVEIDYGNLEKSASQVVSKLKSKDVEDGFLGSIGKIETYVSHIKAWNDGLDRSNDALNKESEILERQQKVLGINTEAQNEQNKALAAQAEILKKLRIEAEKLGMKNAKTAPEEEIRVWINAYKEKQKYQEQESESDRKKREKAIEDAKKHSEDLRKQLEDSEKELLSTKRSFQDLNLGLQKDGYLKEKSILDEEYARKLEDLKSKIENEQSEIDKLNQDIKSGKNSKSDIAILRETIANKKAIQDEFNATMIVVTQTHNIKIASLQEKYLAEDFKKEDEAFKRKLQNLQTAHNFELAAITNLEEAKAYLSETLSVEELAKIKTLEQAKTAIKEQQAKEQYAVQLEYLQKVSRQYQSLLELDASSGFELLSDEEREKTIKNLEEIRNKLSELVIKDPNAENEDVSDGFKASSGVDILGFSPEQWENVFSGLDTFQSKFEALKTVIGGVQQAFGVYFEFLNANENRNLANFERSTNKKKRELQDQLDKGYINQDLYNSRVQKLDADLDKKRAELEYKQAKRQKAMQIAQVISSTALAIMGIWRDFPKVDFGATALVMSGVVGALGAAQLATIVAQPLPSPDGGFYDGGYTGSGPTRGKAGDVHFGEYVIPNKVLFDDDPAMPAIIDYVEAKRNGKSPVTSPSENVSPNETISSPSSVGGNSETNDVLNRLRELLERMQENGIVAYLNDDLKTMKKIRDKIKELELLENK